MPRDNPVNPPLQRHNAVMPATVLAQELHWGVTSGTSHGAVPEPAHRQQQGAVMSNDYLSKLM